MGNPSNGPAAVTWLNMFCLDGYRICNLWASSHELSLQEMCMQLLTYKEIRSTDRTKQNSENCSLFVVARNSETSLRLLFVSFRPRSLYPEIRRTWTHKMPPQKHQQIAYPIRALGHMWSHWALSRSRNSTFIDGLNSYNFELRRR